MGRAQECDNTFSYIDGELYLGKLLREEFDIINQNYKCEVYHVAIPPLTMDPL